MSDIKFKLVPVEEDTETWMDKAVGFFITYVIGWPLAIFFLLWLAKLIWSWGLNILGLI